jgi:lysozyme
MAKSKKSKKVVNKLLFLFGALILLFVVSWFGYRGWLYYKAKFRRYAEFGIDIPENYSIHGIDVSKYQSIIAWEEVQKMQVRDVKLGFAFIKATEGVNNIDALFRRNWKKSKQAGIIRGAYHFFVATKDGRKQAENFINMVDLEKGDLPPVLDVEQTNGVSKEVLRKEVRKWLNTICDNYGVKPIIYTNVDFYNQYLGGTDFDDYPLWVAHYYQEHKPRITRDWIFWQHSEEGRVNGILSRVDFNVFSGDSLEFRNILIN